MCAPTVCIVCREDEEEKCTACVLLDASTISMHSTRMTSAEEDFHINYGLE